jgi:hypothetical protein
MIRKMRRRRFAAALALAALLGLVWVEGSGCRRKTAPAAYPGPAKLPTAAPYKPPPTRVWPTLRPGQPTLRPTLPG